MRVRAGAGMMARSCSLAPERWSCGRFTRARLSPELAWADVFAVAVLSGIGFTVSLASDEAKPPL